MDWTGDNGKKLFPPLALGVCITLFVALFNHLIHERRLPAMAVGNSIFERVRDETGESFRFSSASPMRILAGLVNMSDDFVTDIMYGIRGSGEFEPTADRIAVVAIDEASLLRLGPWPWPRTEVARLMAKLSGAKAVGLDIVFADPDGTSIINYADEFEALFGAALNKDVMKRLDNDLALARQISRTPTILGALLHNTTVKYASPARPIANYGLAAETRGGEAVPGEDVLLKTARHVATDIPPLRETAPPPLGEGFVNLFPDPGGRVRNIPLLVHVSNAAFSGVSAATRRIYPSLALEMIRVALGGDYYDVALRNNTVNIPQFIDGDAGGDRHPIRGVTIKKGGNGGERLITIPLNELGEIKLGFRNPQRDYGYYPAWEVLAGMHDDDFRDKLVLVGATIKGVGHVVSTGYPEPDIPAAEAHAFVLSAILRNDFMDSGYHDDYSWQQSTILASGLAATLGIIFGDLGVGMLISALGLLFATIGNYLLFFRRGMNVGMTLPVLSILAVLAAQAAANHLLVGRERRFIRKAFQLNVSPSILGYLESHPDRLSSLQGEHRHMSVLFTDIRGFTSISERMTAPDLARFINEYFTPMSDIVMKNAGTVDKFIGDGLMAFWNAPADNPRHARDCAASALGMLGKLAELQTGWTNRGLPKVSIGCGINTGAMFAGYMGSNQRKNYTVMGDNVNIASRLEGLNKFYSSSILITESTRTELGGRFICRVTDKVRVSGKDKAVVIYELLGDGSGTDEEMEELAAFARVFELYQMREFATAESLLKELMFIRPAPLYKMYLDRLAVYKALPPPDDWDGTFAMTHK